MRIVCGFRARHGPASPRARGSTTPTRRSATGSAGARSWSSGSGVTLAGASTAPLRTKDTSARLTAYPTNLLTQALADTSVSIVATPGGATLPPFDIADASPLPGAGQVASVAHASPPGRASAAARSRSPPRPRSRPRPPGPRWRDQRRPALDLPLRRPVAARPAGLDPDRRRARGRPRADARPRQDADGGLSRRDARDAAPRRGARAVGDVLAHARDPGPRRAGRRGRRVPAAGPRSSSRRRSWRPSRSWRSAAGC